MNDKQKETEAFRFRTEVVCPYCSKPGTMQIYPMIEADETMRTLIDSGDLFLYRCPYCHEAVAVNYPLCYFDDEKGIMIENMPEDAEPADPEEAGDYVIRKTESVIDLQEKVRIFEDHRDDRIIELVKAILREDFRGKGIICGKMYYVREDQYKGMHFRCDHSNAHIFSSTGMYDFFIERDLFPEFRSDPIEVVDERYGEQQLERIDDLFGPPSMLS